MKDMTPDAWFASWSENGTNITLPIGSVTDLTAAEADVTTGDIREVLFKMLETLKAAQDALPTADKPEYMTLYSTSAFNSSGKVVTKYSVTFTRDIATSDATTEP